MLTGGEEIIYLEQEREREKERVLQDQDVECVVVEIGRAHV